jgi:7-cyano-7-deazaguanine synthase
LTWSCYHGGKYHCGKCGTCTERMECLTNAGTPDPTTYRWVAA